jgi:hypothetical protein
MYCIFRKFAVLRGLKILFKNKTLSFQYLNCAIFILAFLFSSVSFNENKVVFLKVPEYPRMLFLFSMPVWLDALSKLGSVEPLPLGIVTVGESIVGSLIFILSFVCISLTEVVTTEKLKPFLFIAFFLSLIFVLVAIFQLVMATCKYLKIIKGIQNKMRLKS